MKRMLMVALAVFSLISSYGCAGYCKYQDAYWNKRAAVENMATAKLQNQPVKADGTNGFWGMVVNHSGRGVTVYFDGPENFNIYLYPQWTNFNAGGVYMKELYLLPGEYHIEVKDGETVLKSCTIHSGVQFNYFGEIATHWFVEYHE